VDHASRLILDVAENANRSNDPGTADCQKYWWQKYDQAMLVAVSQPRPSFCHQFSCPTTRRPSPTGPALG
jgi:hypothetical protein